MNRWLTYQKERFPLLAHGPLIAAFSACAVSYSSLLRGSPIPSPWMFLTAFIVCLLMFLQLRIADEFKDAEEDAKWRPYRAVPRGLVSLKELRIVFIVAALVQAGLVLLLDPRLILILAIAWSYLALMSVEFFARDWLKNRPVIYLVSHMGIMPLVDFFATSCEWLPRGATAPTGLGWFLAASFFNGIVIELGRKLRQPADEEEGVETYSRLWGKGRASIVWLIALAATLASAAFAAHAIQFSTPVLIVLSIFFLVAAFEAYRYRTTLRPGKKIEYISALWTLSLYLMLGLIPLVLHHTRS
ncbi:UbiA family prenyltransferase [Luteolibacter sp. AS25]|uniref:UbiA family prenyltransferase n=1 Tax=Luteolibacter sp. AS25 TaxID=3135776 RepID=UPI00398B3C04